MEQWKRRSRALRRPATCALGALLLVGVGASPAWATVPDAPAKPTVGVGSGTLVVNFTAVSATPAVTSYAAACTPNSGAVQSGTGASSPIVITGASNGMTYRCSVTATNDDGTSPPSPNSATVVPAGPPDNPAPPTLTPANHAIVVSFVAPADNGSAITGYEVDCTATDGSANVSVHGAGSPITVGGLTNGKEYTCDVTAFNGMGIGESDPAGPVVPAGVPNAPAKPSVTRANASIIVSFNLPADNGTPISKTTATCTSSNGGVTRSRTSEPIDPGETFSPITVTGLTNTKSYTCRVTATNEGGTGPASPPSAVVALVTKPGAPTNVVARTGSATGASGPIVVSFHPGATNGGAITSYRATCTEGGNGKSNIKTGTTTTLIVPGNTAGRTYSCYVVDVNAAGASARSTAASVTVGTPGAPPVTKVSRQNQRITVSFKPPADNGSPITVYRVLCTSTNGGVTQRALKNASPMLVKGLTLGRTYTCLLNATNARGSGLQSKMGPFTMGQ